MTERRPFNPERQADSEEPEEESEQISRRHFLKKIGVGLGAMASVELAGKSLGALADARTPDLEKVITTQEYATGPLAGRVFSDLYSDYTGITGRVPAVARTNFSKQLRALCAKKEAFVKRRHPHDANTVFRTASNRLISEYESNDPERTTLAAYSDSVARTIKETYSALNWDEVGSSLHLDKNETHLAKDIAESIHAADLLAYSLTELMPSKDGMLNRQVLEFLLKNAGERYVYSLPAVYDDMTSFGPYQFTSYALFDNGKEHRGASMINHALPLKLELPGSVINLRAEEHHRAAYLFIIQNMGSLLNRLTPVEMKTFEKNWKHHKDGIVKFAATAHHLPTAAFASARRWIDHGMTTPFEASCGANLRDYALKTQANLDALRKI